MKTKILIAGLAIIAFGLVVTTVYAHGPAYQSNKDITTDVKKVDRGIQITVTSDDPNITKYIQENTGWYENAFECCYSHCQDTHGKEWQPGCYHGCM